MTGMRIIIKCRKYRQIFGFLTICFLLLPVFNLLLFETIPYLLQRPHFNTTKATVEPDTWQSMNGQAQNDQMYAFSAFYDKRYSNMLFVRIIGICPIAFQASAGQWLCAYYEDEVIVGQGQIQQTFFEQNPQNVNNYKYSTCILACAAPLLSSKRIIYVSLTSNITNPPTNLLRVHNSRQRGHQYNFTVCLAPINRFYGDRTDNTFQYGEFLEFMEVNSMFGADRFVMYNVSTGNSIERHIRAYQREGKLHLIDWQLPVGTEDSSAVEVFYFAQLAALNDCVYRYMYTSKYIVVCDLDEIIVPLKTSSWSELLTAISGNQNRSLFSFRNTFFRKEFTPDAEAHSLPLVEELKLRTLLFTKREQQIWAQNQRAKYIARPDKIIVAGAHFLYQALSEDALDVENEDALLFHYRNWLQFEEAQRTAFVVNRRMYDFKDEILKRIHLRHMATKK